MTKPLKLYAGAALFSGFAGLASTTLLFAQEIAGGIVLTPTTTLLPIGIAFGFLTTAVWSTYKATRFLDGLEAERAEIAKQIAEVRQRVEHVEMMLESAVAPPDTGGPKDA